MGKLLTEGMGLPITRAGEGSSLQTIRRIEDGNYYLYDVKLDTDNTRLYYVL
jgi:hypothetical protein